MNKYRRIFSAITIFALVISFFVNWRVNSNIVHAAITVRSSARTDTSTGTVNLPSNIQAGDYILAFVINRPVSTYTAPTGWTHLTYVEASTSSSGAKIEVFGKVANGTEGATQQFSQTETTSVDSWYVLSLTGVDTSNPVDVWPQNNNGGSTAAASGEIKTHSGLSVTTPGSWFFFAGAFNPGVSGSTTSAASSNSGMTTLSNESQTNSTNHRSWIIQYEQRTSTGASGSRGASNNVGGRWVNTAFAIRPATSQGTDTTPPAVSISSPSAGSTVSGSSVAITANASDNVGVAGVQFKLNGSNLGSEDTSAPFTNTWDTTSTSNGSYTLTATARDAAGNQTTSTGVSVTVSNSVTPPPPPVTPPPGPNPPPPPAAPGSCTSISQYGITWFFNQAYPCGQFATGDWWVTGPVTITNITPKDTVNDGVDIHGSMINPVQSLGGAQGWDSRSAGQSSGGNPYSSALNVAKSFPLVVQNGSSLLSSESYPVSSVAPNYGRPDDNHYPYHKSVAILTVLASTPSEGSFRPPYIGNDKTIKSNWNKASVNYSKLNNVTPLANSPTLSTLQQYAVEPQIEIITGWKGRYLHPADNYNPSRICGGSPNYGQCIARVYGAMLLGANMNYTQAEKEPIVTRLIQLGIDIYGTGKTATQFEAGAVWAHGGGHNHGRKMPMLFAGMLLNDTDIIARANQTIYKWFQEDYQHFYVSAADVAITHVACCNRYVEQYTSAHIGMPEWGVNHIHQPVEDNSWWGASYRSIVGGSLIPHVLAAHLMGATSLWNHPALFDYYNTRYFPAEQNNTGGTNEMETYVRDLWSAYRNTPPPTGGTTTPPPSNQVSAPVFTPNNASSLSPVSVSISSPTSGATIRYTTNGSEPTSSSTVYSGPLTISSTTTIKAKAFKSGMTDSFSSSSVISINNFASQDYVWTNIPLTNQTSSFTISFDTMPFANNIDAVTGLSNVSANAYQDLAAIIRFNTSGTFDARNGGAYSAVSTFPYSANTTYRVVMTVNPSTKTYSATVTPSGGSPVTIANNYSFRTEQSTISNISNLALYTITENSGHSVSNISIGTGTSNPPPPPPASQVSKTLTIDTEGRTDKALSGTLEILNSSKGLIKSYPFTTNSSGTVSLNIDQTSGTLFFKIKAAPYLHRLLSGDINTILTFPQLKTGDINQDNLVNSIDFSVLNTNWFTTHSGSDLNKDSIINSLDFSLMNRNWFVRGEE